MARNQRRNRRNKSGGSQPANRGTGRVDEVDRSAGTVRRRSSTETKSALRTTELIAYVGAVLAVVMTALAVDEDGRGGGDPFGAEPAIRYITFLTIGYLVARGLAKSGSHENRIEHDSDSDDDDAAVTTVADDHDGDDDVDEADDAPEPAGPAAVPVDRAERVATEKVDARP